MNNNGYKRYDVLLLQCHRETHNKERKIIPKKKKQKKQIGTSDSRELGDAELIFQDLILLVHDF